jgi:hypothetical protein
MHIHAQIYACVHTHTHTHTHTHKCIHKTLVQGIKNGFINKCGGDRAPVEFEPVQRRRRLERAIRCVLGVS